MGIFQSKPKEAKHVVSEPKKEKLFVSEPEEARLVVPEPEGNDTVIKWSKCALTLFFRYIGTDYHGLQYQEGYNTIDGELFKSFEKCGFTPENTGKCRGKIQWLEASRTDAGVHACAQLVEFYATGVEGMTCKEVVDKINANLSKDAPIYVMSAIANNIEFPIQKFATNRKYNFLLPLHAFKDQSEEHLKFLRENICPLFVGRHNFHNYTSNVAARNPSAIRFITDFTFGDPFTVDGEQFVLFYIRGNSFMLNQIRKMVGTVVAASHGIATKEEIEKSLLLGNCRIQVIPGDGLMLLQIEYEDHMNKLKKQTINNDVEFRAWRPAVEDWKQNVLFRHIAKIVKEQDMFRKWVNTVLLNSTFHVSEPVADKK